MPKLTAENMQSINTSSNYSFSAVGIDQLGASEYTEVTVAVDTSGSLSGLEKDLEKMLNESIGACKKSPRAENLMARVVYFNSNEKEIHGFRLLNTIKDDEYNGTVQTGGCTALFDTTYHAIEATLAYAKTLTANDFTSNAIIFVITDGLDNESSFTPSMIKKLIDDAQKKEEIESINIVLIGMNTASISQELERFKNEANITQYVDCGSVNAKTLAKLAAFVSKSISSTSQALGTGGMSKSLTF